MQKVIIFWCYLNILIQERVNTVLICNFKNYLNSFTMNLISFQNTRVYRWLIYILCGLSFKLNAKDESLEISADSLAMLQTMYLLQVDSVNQTFEYQTGKITLGNDLATLSVPEGFKYLDGDQSERVLTEIWGNPPSEPKSLGMILPYEYGPASPNT